MSLLTDHKPQTTNHATKTMANRVKHRANTRNITGILSLATEADIFEGKEWYARAHRFGVQLIAAYDVTMGQAVGVIAALSPNNKWERNCADADRLINAYLSDHDLSLTKVCTYNTNKQKAIKILDLNMESAEPEAIESILKGRKVTAFFRSIMGDPNAVCVDGHAYSVFIGQRIPTTKTPNIGKGLYETIQRAYCLVADRSFEICGHKLTPTQVQAVTWVTYRRLLKG
jgi:hypothetical protein